MAALNLEQKTILAMNKIQSQMLASCDEVGMNKAVADFGYVGRTFDNIYPNVSIKSQYSQSDYDYYRQNEMTPQNPREILEVCNRAYKKEGLVRNIIDLMAEFGCKGVKIVCPNKRQEKLGNEWFKYVSGSEVSERFLNLLYRMAHVPVSITYGTVPVKIEKKWSSTYGIQNQGNIDLNEEAVVTEDVVKNRRLPLNYIFLNPLSVHPIAPELSAFTNKPLYGLLITHSLRNALRKAESIPDQSIQDLVNAIPQDIKNSLSGGMQIIPLKSEDFSMYYYKKDDWETYATPMLYSIIPDLVMLEKMKLADKSALDGAISNIRLWTLGKLNDTNPLLSIIPNKSAINKLRSVLANNVGGGTLDLVWGPELSFTESNTQVHKFLGITKYEPIYKCIYEGMGVPSSLSGGGDGGFNNSFIQMQTFVERLQYGRSVLKKFWTQELQKVQRALGYKKAFQISFDEISLGDDTSMKNLLLGLVDRDVMSVETLLDKFNCFSEVEIAKIKREYRQRQKDNIPDKTGPYPTTTQTDNDMKKTILNQGGVAPSEVGVKLKPKKPGEKTGNDHQMQLEKFKLKNKPINNNGRPLNKKDSQKRKKRAVKPSTSKGFVSTFLWANAAQKEISDLITPIMLEDCGKANVRSLSREETDQLESIKFMVLANITPYSEINKEIIADLFSSQLSSNAEIDTQMEELLYTFTTANNRQPTIDEMRQIQSSAYAVVVDLLDEDGAPGGDPNDIEDDDEPSIA